MCSKSKYCRCLNKYTVTECQKGSGNCDVPYYWFQGVGKTSIQVVTISSYKARVLSDGGIVESLNCLKI